MLTFILKQSDPSFSSLRNIRSPDSSRYGAESNVRAAIKASVFFVSGIAPVEGKEKGVPLTNRNALCFGEPCRDRTDNLLIKSQLLYQLS